MTQVEELQPEAPDAETVEEVTAIPESEQPPAPTAEAAAAQPDMNDIDAAMAWLESLAAKQGAEEETLFTSTEERLAAPPDWVSEELAKAQAEGAEKPATSERGDGHGEPLAVGGHDRIHRLAVGDAGETRRIDLGRASGQYFALRLTMGFEAEMVAAATRELKDRYGWLAYALTGLQTLAAPSDNVCCPR